MQPKNKNEKSEDYSKADLKQRVLFFYNNISAGHTSLLQVYRSYWTYVVITILYYILADLISSLEIQRLQLAGSSSTVFAVNLTHE